jgi:hypothetical protein
MWGGMRLSPLGIQATVGPTVPQIIDEYGAVGGMRFSRGNQSTQRKSAPMPLYPPQIPHDLIWDQTWATAVKNW